MVRSGGRRAAPEWAHGSAQPGAWIGWHRAGRGSGRARVTVPIGDVVQAARMDGHTVLSGVMVLARATDELSVSREWGQ